jgi:pimeloyl-ACP methyl ester carboxylesterase
VLAAAVLASSCGGGGDDDGGARGGNDERSARGTLEWQDCGDDVECARLDVPLDHEDPGGETIELALARRRAGGDPIGTLLVNPGGPGFAAIPLVTDAVFYLGEELLERFDVVAWDPRGVGDSTSVDCGDDLDAFYAVDRSPDDAAEVEANAAAARRLARACARRSGDLLAHVSTYDTVRDLDLVREALGEEQITYLGFSYGTQIGALYADRYPRRVRAMVLDGAVDPSLRFEELALGQATGFDAALDAFLDWCAAGDCGFGGSDPHRAYRMLMAQIDAEPLFARSDDETRELGPGEADIAVAAALYYGEEGWEALADALREAAQGDGSALLSFADDYTGREPGGRYADHTDALYAIGCTDAPVPSLAEFPQVAARAEAAATNFGAATVWLSAPCAVWPVPPAGAPGPVRAAGAPPIVVVGTSNDPATPLRWAQALADQLESGRLVVAAGEGHTAYNRESDCVDDLVHRYLVDLVVPEDGTRC